MRNGVMTCLEKIGKKVENVALYYAISMSVVMITIVVSGVVARYVLRNPFTWVEELARYSMIIMAFFGMSVIIAKQENIRIDVLIDRLPVKVRNMVVLFTEILCIPFIALLIFQGSILAWESRLQLTESLPISRIFIMIHLPVSAVFMLIQLIIRILFNISHISPRK